MTNICTPKILQYIRARAKKKKDGVYEWYGVVYRVRSFNVTHYSSERDILECCGNFNVVIGRADTHEQQKKKLKDLK